MNLFVATVSRDGQCGAICYFVKCNMAVVGGGFAVLQTGKVRMHGFLAWQAWGLVHLRSAFGRRIRDSAGPV